MDYDLILLSQCKVRNKNMLRHTAHIIVSLSNTKHLQLIIFHGLSRGVVIWYRCYFSSWLYILATQNKHKTRKCIANIVMHQSLTLLYKWSCQQTSLVFGQRQNDMSACAKLNELVSYILKYFFPNETHLSNRLINIILFKVETECPCENEMLWHAYFISSQKYLPWTTTRK